MKAIQATPQLRSKGVLELEHWQYPIRGARHRRRKNAHLARAQTAVEARGIGIGLSNDSSRSHLSREGQGLLNKGSANPLPDAAGLYPNVLQRPPLAVILEGAHPDDLTSALRHQHAVVGEVLRPECQLRLPGGEPFCRIAPVSLGALSQMAQTRGVVGGCPSDGKWHDQGN